jgi:hypothetical protein
MHKIQLMAPELGPPKCLTCGRGNTPDGDDTLDDFWVMDLERDVNWGDPAYICRYCCEKIAQEAGHAPIEVLEEKDEIIRAQRGEIHRVETERDSIRRRFRAVTTGRKALTSAKKQVASS